MHLVVKYKQLFANWFYLLQVQVTNKILVELFYLTTFFLKSIAITIDVHLFAYFRLASDSGSCSVTTFTSKWCLPHSAMEFGCFWTFIVFWWWTLCTKVWVKSSRRTSSISILIKKRGKDFFNIKEKYFWCILFLLNFILDNLKIKRINQKTITLKFMFGLRA